jgi:hypothetical protein
LASLVNQETLATFNHSFIGQVSIFSLVLDLECIAIAHEEELDKMFVFLTTLSFDRNDLKRLAVPIHLVEIARVALDLCLLMCQSSDSLNG